MTVQLSASKLSMLRGDTPCPRCFYDHVVCKIERPRGAFPSLPGGVDREIKAYCDRHRALGMLPPKLAPALPAGARLWGNAAQIKKWRHWKTVPPAPLPGAQIIGGFDEIVVMPDGTYASLDGKTNGAEPKPDDQRWYQTQTDVYALLLESAGMPPAETMYLWYWWPYSEGDDDDHKIAFDSQVVEITASPKRARDLVAEGLAILDGERPRFTAGCEYCEYRKTA